MAAPETLMANAACLSCLPKGERKSIRLALLAKFFAAIGATSVSFWTARTAAVSGLWRDVDWSPELGLFIAVNEQNDVTTNKVMTSPDGITWTSRTAAGANADSWRAARWSSAAGRIVAVSGTGKVMSSTDGITWALGTASSAALWTGVDWSPQLSLWVSVGVNAAQWSSDGVNWTAGTIANANWRDVRWSPQLGLFCAVATTGQIATSADGKTWTQQTSPAANSWNGVEWSPELGLFVSVSGTGTQPVMTSPDGVNWTLQNAAGTSTWNDVKWSPELRIFVAIAETGTAAQRSMSSPDGVNWTFRTVPSASNQWRALAWSPTLIRFVAVGFTAGAANEVITTSKATLPLNN